LLSIAFILDCFERLLPVAFDSYRHIITSSNFKSNSNSISNFPLKGASY